MKLIELIPNLKNFAEAKQFIVNVLPDVEIDFIDLYTKSIIDIESEIFFFDSDKIPPTIEFEVNGIQFISFFSLKMAVEMIEEGVNEGFNYLEIAERMIEYRIYDA